MELLTTHSAEFIALFALGLIALGALSGFLAGLFGVGGGVVLVPGLYALFTLLGFEHEMLMHLCVGTSLAIIVPTGLSAARAHHRRGSVDFDLLKTIGPGIVVGVITGAALAAFLTGDALKLIFALTISALAVLMILDPARFQLVSHMPRQPVPSIAGVIIGHISTLIGIGGATLSVPFMSICHVPIRTAIGTAAALGLFISIPAMIGFVLIGFTEDELPPFSFGFVNGLAWLAIVPSSVLIAPLGARLAHRLPVSLMRKGFAIFMIVVAAKMLHGL